MVLSVRAPAMALRINKDTRAERLRRLRNASHITAQPATPKACAWRWRAVRACGWSRLHYQPRTPRHPRVDCSLPGARGLTSPLLVDTSLCLQAAALERQLPALIFAKAGVLRTPPLKVRPSASSLLNLLPCGLLQSSAVCPMCPVPFPPGGAFRPPPGAKKKSLVPLPVG